MIVIGKHHPLFRAVWDGRWMKFGGKDLILVPFAYFRRQSSTYEASTSASRELERKMDDSCRIRFDILGKKDLVIFIF